MWQGLILAKLVWPHICILYPYHLESKIFQISGMCKQCVRRPFPDRDRMCLESGAYMINMNKCINCSKNNLKVEQIISDSMEEDMSDSDTEEETETVVYNHVCANCDHLVSKHKVHASRHGFFWHKRQHFWFPSDDVFIPSSNFLVELLKKWKFFPDLDTIANK